VRSPDVSGETEHVREFICLRDKIMELANRHSCEVSGPVLFACAAEVVVAGFTGGDDAAVVRFRELVTNMWMALKGATSPRGNA
jgi:hypothetical protein